jgi:hypothetical protein
MLGNATETSLGTAFTPASFFDDGFEDPSGTRTVPEHFQTEGNRVLAGSAGQFIYETLHHKCVGGIPD